MAGLVLKLGTLERVELPKGTVEPKSNENDDAGGVVGPPSGVLGAVDGV